MWIIPISLIVLSTEPVSYHMGKIAGNQNKQQQYQLCQQPLKEDLSQGQDSSPDSALPIT